MTHVDSYEDWDAAYVMGALPAQERMSYEEHLRDCANCTAAVSELAALPGLLMQIPPAQILAMDANEPESEAAPSPRPAPLDRAGRRRPRIMRPRVAWAVAATALVLAGGGAAGFAAGYSTAPTASIVATPPERLAFTEVVPIDMTAVVDLIPTEAGTTVRVECQYAYTPGVPAVEYSVWLIGNDGSATLGTTWSSAGGTVMHPQAHTSLAVADIASIEIRNSAGSTVMHAQVSR